MIDAVEESYPMISFTTKEESLLYRPVGKIAPTLIPALNKSKVAAMMPKAEDVKVEIEVDPASLLDTAKVDVKVKLKE